MSNARTLFSMKKVGKVQPFGAHFTTRLQSVNSKLICALSQEDGKGGEDTGCDDNKGMPPEEQARMEEEAARAREAELAVDTNPDAEKQP